MIKASVLLKDNTSKILRELQDKAVAFVTAGGEKIQENAVDNLKRLIYSRETDRKKTGNLLNSVQTETFVEDGVPTNETGVTNSAPYGVYIEYGTGIYAVGGNGRKTPWGYEDDEGTFHWTWGSRAYPFMEPGYRKAVPQINRLKALLAL
jgi:hypothetical protein